MFVEAAESRQRMSWRRVLARSIPTPPAVAEFHQLADGQQDGGVAGDGIKNGEAGIGWQRRCHLVDQLLGAAAAACMGTRRAAP